MVRDERSEPLDGLLAGLLVSWDPRDRAVATQALVALGERPLATGLGDADPRVRRAAAAGAPAVWSTATRSALLTRMATESDAATRQILAVGLVDGDPDGVLSTQELLNRARGPGADAPLAALALAARPDAKVAPDVDALLASHDPILRAHIAQGLGSLATPDAVGHLLHAYAVEPDGRVRRAIIWALAAQAHAHPSPAARGALGLAARLDPDAIARTTATQALSGLLPPRPSFARDVAWLNVTTAGSALPKDMTGALVPETGVALPFAYDDDGYALVVGAAAGVARVRLAPRVPSYQAGAR